MAGKMQGDLNGEKELEKIEGIKLCRIEGMKVCRIEGIKVCRIKGMSKACQIKFKIMGIFEFLRFIVMHIF